MPLRAYSLFSIIDFSAIYSNSRKSVSIAFLLLAHLTAGYDSPIKHDDQKPSPWSMTSSRQVPFETKPPDLRNLQAQLVVNEHRLSAGLVKSRLQTEQTVYRQPMFLDDGEQRGLLHRKMRSVQSDVLRYLPECAKCKDRCGEKVTFAYRDSCSCDQQCLHFNDRCLDFEEVCPQHHKEAEKYQEQFANLPDPGCISLSSPPSVGYNPTVKVIQTCAINENVCSVSAEAPETFGPVLDTDTGIHFINTRCALCNGAQNVKPWVFEATCISGPLLKYIYEKPKSVLSEENKNIFENKFTNVSQLEMISRIMKEQEEGCKLRLEPPKEMLPRPCYEIDVDPVMCTGKHDNISNACMSTGSNVVFEMHLRVSFKNIYCLLCEFPSPHEVRCGTQDVMGSERFPFNPWRMPVLFTLNPNRNAHEETETSVDLPDKPFGGTMCKSNELMIDLRCRSVFNGSDVCQQSTDPPRCLTDFSKTVNCTWIQYNKTEVTLRNGTLTFKNTNQRINSIHWFHGLNESYLVCFNSSLTTDAGTSRGLGPSSDLNNALDIAWITLIFISVIMLIVRIGAQYFISELQQPVGKMHASLSVAIMISMIMLILSPLHSSNITVCYMVGVVIHWAYLASFSWMSVLSLNISRMTYMSSRLRILGLGRNMFLKCSAIAWGIPTIVTTVAVVADHAPIAEQFKPRYGIHECWIGNFYPQIIYFVIPIAASSLINTVAFIVAIILLCRTNTNKMAATSNVNRSEVALFLRLFIIMGITWSLWFFAQFTQNTLCLKIFALLFAAQGILLALGTLCVSSVRKSGWKLLRHHDCFRAPPSGGSSDGSFPESAKSTV